MDIPYYSVEYWQENMDELIERVEQGEHIGVENEDGSKAVFVPLDDDTYKMYTELNNEAQ